MWALVYGVNEIFAAFTLREAGKRVERLLGQYLPPERHRAGPVGAPGGVHGEATTTASKGQLSCRIRGRAAGWEAYGPAGYVEAGWPAATERAGAEPDGNACT